jgi:hypothetical protein
MLKKDAAAVLCADHFFSYNFPSREGLGVCDKTLGLKLDLSRPQSKKIKSKFLQIVSNSTINLIRNSK